jgi:hypothetical protein
MGFANPTLSDTLVEPERKLDMIRVLAATLVFAQMWAFSAPVASSAAPAEAAHPCEQVVGQNDANVVTSTHDCACCGMDDCCGPFTCTAPVLALLEGTVQKSMAPLVTEHGRQTTWVAESFLAPPLPRPPQA